MQSQKNFGQTFTSMRHSRWLALLVIVTMVLVGTATGEVPQPNDPVLRDEVENFEREVGDLLNQYREAIQQLAVGCAGSPSSGNPGCTASEFHDRLADEIHAIAANLRQLGRTALQPICARATQLGGLDALLGTGGDLDRAVFRIEQVFLCAIAEITQGLQQLQDYQTRNGLVRCSAGIPRYSVSGEDLTQCLPGPPLEPKRVRIFDVVTLTHERTGSLKASGQAPAGATVVVVLGCVTLGGSQVVEIQVTADENCRWELDLDTNPTLAFCAMVVYDKDNLSNIDSTEFSTP